VLVHIITVVGLNGVKTMRTLDEVIESLERGEPSFGGALYYLREYRAVKEEYRINNAKEARWQYHEAKIRYISTHPEDDNLPLTWDELKGMEGKPVWVEYIKTSTGKMDGHIWAIVHKAYEKNGDEDEEIFCSDMIRLKKKLQRTRWQAYRKERDEDAG
jgi:hypothetical protein